MSSLRQLFGGAITAELPTAFVDASTVRQVPDTQEVFFSPTSDVSYIVEILQKVESDDPRDAARFHFDSLAHDNEARSSTVLDIVVPESVASLNAGDTPAPIFLDGSQQVAKLNRRTPDDVRILLAVYRFETQDVDLVLSANLPVAKESGGGLGEAEFNLARDAFLAAARSLKVVDFGLFA